MTVFKATGHVPPSDWGKDELSAFIDKANHNCWATFYNKQPIFVKLSAIDCALKKLIDGVSNSKDYFSGLFLLQSHAAYRSAICVAISTQIPPSYALIRLMLEHAVYGHFLSRNRSLCETWLRKHDDELCMKAVKDNFKIGTMMDGIKPDDEKLQRIVRQLYTRTIDYGAHPNEAALSQALKMEKKDKNVIFNLSYLTGDSLALDHCLRTLVQVGIAVLKVFKLIYPERCLLLGLNEEIDLLAQNL